MDFHSTAARPGSFKERLESGVRVESGEVAASASRVARLKRQQKPSSPGEYVKLSRRKFPCRWLTGEEERLAENSVLRIQQRLLFARRLQLPGILLAKIPCTPV